MSKFLRPQSLNDSICGDCAFAVSQNLAHAEFYPFKFYRAYLGGFCCSTDFEIRSAGKILFVA
ncbi:hypothetical protein [uncultured Campylobacter sp.]|uniref:hypothetical protein n=1 Tax=uncultured Campylobacter sp. TaxID=218934 RepID=UPI0026292886|nr:hypothetical protein [uncultured Campylobacter sp.]